MDVIPYYTKADSIAYPVGKNMKNLYEAVNDMYKVLMPHIYTNTVFLWVQGSSGAMIGALTAAKFIQDGFVPRVIQVRKEHENSHDSGWEYPSGVNITNVILDDHIYHGKTLKRVYNELKDAGNSLDIIAMLDHWNKSTMANWMMGIKFDKFITISSMCNTVVSQLERYNKIDSEYKTNSSIHANFSTRKTEELKSVTIERDLVDRWVKDLGDRGIGGVKNDVPIVNIDPVDSLMLDLRPDKVGKSDSMKAFELMMQAVGSIKFPFSNHKPKEEIPNF